MIQLRPATSNDIPLLSYWDTKPHVQVATGDASGWNWQQELSRDRRWTQHFIAELSRRPLGVIQIIDPANEETHYWGAVQPNQRAIDIWIGEEADLGQGYGSQMMWLALDRCFAQPEVVRVLIDPLASNTAAHRFYRRLGFEFIEQRYFDEDDCLVFGLSRAQYAAKGDLLKNSGESGNLCC